MGLLSKLKNTVTSAVKSTAKAIVAVHTNPIKAITQGVKAVPGAAKDALAYTNPFDKKSLVQSTLGVVTKNVIKPITVPLAESNPVFSSIAKFGRPADNLLRYTQKHPTTSLLVVGAAVAAPYLIPAAPTVGTVGAVGTTAVPTVGTVGAVAVPTAGVVGGASVLGTLGTSLGVAATGAVVREGQKQVDKLLGNDRQHQPEPKRFNMMWVYVGGGVVALLGAILLLRK